VPVNFFGGLWWEIAFFDGQEDKQLGSMDYFCENITKFFFFELSFHRIISLRLFAEHVYENLEKHYKIMNKK